MKTVLILSIKQRNEWYKKLAVNKPKVLYRPVLMASRAPVQSMSMQIMTCCYQMKWMTYKAEILHCKATLDSWQKFWYESFPRCSICGSTCWHAVQLTTIVLKLPPLPDESLDISFNAATQCPDKDGYHRHTNLILLYSMPSIKQGVLGNFS